MEIHPFRADHLDGELALCVAEGWPELQAFLTSIAVNVRYRGRGIGRALVEASLRMAGAERIDLLSEEASVGFYESFPHFRKPGFRLYPFYQPNEDSGA